MQEDRHSPGELRLSGPADALVGAASASMRIDAGWPDVIPTFAPIAMPSELVVPIFGIEPRFGGVEAGDRFVRRSTEGKPHSLSPSAGTIESITNAWLFDGSKTSAVRLATAVGPPADKYRPDLGEARPDRLGEWIDILREHGIWAARHTSPDLIGQCYAALARPVDTVLLNLLDVDPALPTNAALAATEPASLHAGADLISRIIGATRIWVAIDDQIPPDWLSKFNEPAESEVEWNFIPLVNDYPQSDPSLLLYALLNRRLAPMRSPVDAGTIVIDAAAAIAVGNVILKGEPMLTVPVAIRDHTHRESHFRTVPIGATLESLLHSLRMPALRWLKLRGGDVLRDVPLHHDSVASGTDLVLHAGALEPSINPDPCVRCGWCFESCPTLVQPANCLEAAQRDDIALARRFGIDGCIECGICSYVCPSHLPILAGIRYLRANLR
ncbi:MAG: 4Fe-4S dicluster domain-containing protein [Phycisphaerae bacterium]|nr:4Fe-4S dicluster domain-containing protein [Phycisphaerae bacterium]